MTLTEIYLIIKRSFFCCCTNPARILLFKRRSCSLGQRKCLENVLYTDRILNLMHLSRRVIKDFWQYLKSSTERCSGVLKDCHRFDVFLGKTDAALVAVTNEDGQNGCDLYEIRSQLSALVVIKHHLTNTLFDSCPPF